MLVAISLSFKRIFRLPARRDIPDDRVHATDLFADDDGNQGRVADYQPADPVHERIFALLRGPLRGKAELSAEPRAVGDIEQRIEWVRRHVIQRIAGEAGRSRIGAAECAVDID